MSGSPGATATIASPVGVLNQPASYDTLLVAKEEQYAGTFPRPRINLVVYHGVLAPHSRCRGLAVAYKGADDTPAKAAAEFAPPGGAEFQGKAPGDPRSWAWADLMQRAFEFDVLACPRCGGRMRVIATIEDPRVIRQILAHLGLPIEGPGPGRSRPPPNCTADLFANIPA